MSGIANPGAGTAGGLTDAQLRATPVPVSVAGNTTATGIIDAAGETVEITVPPGSGGVGIQITGTWVGQLEFERTINGTVWTPAQTSDGISSTNATQANGVFSLAAAGYAKIRMRASSWTSGAATIDLNGSVGAGPVLLSSPLPQGTNLLGSVNVPTAFGKTITQVSVNQAVAGTTVLAAASPSNRHKLVGALLVMSATGSLKLTDGVPTDLTGPMDIVANGGFSLGTSLIPYQQTAVNSELRLVTTVGAARGMVQILTEP